MKMISNIIIRLIPCILFSSTAAEEMPKKFGFIRLANAVAHGEGNLTWRINGENIHEKGYKLGNVTGGIPLQPGSHQVAFSRDGTEAGFTKVDVHLDDTTILIPFAERVPASDEKPAHWAIRILRLKQMEPEEGQTVSFVSVSQTPEIHVEISDTRGKWSPAFVKRLQIMTTPVDFKRGYVPLRTKDAKLESIPIGGKGNHVVLLYDDPDGSLKSLTFRDFKYLSAD